MKILKRTAARQSEELQHAAMHRIDARILRAETRDNEETTRE